MHVLGEEGQSSSASMIRKVLSRDFFACKSEAMISNFMLSFFSLRVIILSGPISTLSVDTRLGANVHDFDLLTIK